MAEAASGRRKWAAFGCALLNGLVAGTPAVFALYAPDFQRRLSYTSVEVNALGIACQIGCYCTVPLVGFACDRYGPKYIALFAAVIALPAYATASVAFRHPSWSIAVMVACYALVGMTTVALYMSALSTVARNHPKSRGLSMALVTASFGSAGLWQVQVADKLYRDRTTGELDVPALFVSMGVMLSAAGLLSYFVLASYTAPSQRHKIRDHFAELDAEADRQMARSADDSSTFSGADADVDPEAADEETALLSRSIQLDKATPGVRMSAFLKDHSSWWYFVAFILLAGPGEVFVNNLGSMYESLVAGATSMPSSGPVPLSSPLSLPFSMSMSTPMAAASNGQLSTSTQVSIFATASTVGRLAFGALSDVPLTRSPIAGKMCILLSAAVIYTLGFAYLSPLSTGSGGSVLDLVSLATRHSTAADSSTLVVGSGWGLTPNTFAIAATLIGIGGGGLFTIYPVIVSVVWGIENLATYWGMLAVAPAIGGSVGGLVYARLYDRNAVDLDLDLDLDLSAAPRNAAGNTAGDSGLRAAADELASQVVARLCKGAHCFDVAAGYFSLAAALGTVVLAGMLVVWVRRFRRRGRA